MASWKKVIVQGSDISLLNNDSNFISLTDLSGGTGITYNNTTGEISLTNTGFTLGTTTINLGDTVTTVNGLTITNGTFSGDGSGLTGLVTDLAFGGNTGTGSIDLQTQTLNITGTGAISTVANNQTLTISVADATTTTKGVASFNSSFFDVASGAVSITNGGITPTQLNASVAGTGLSGGAGTALSVDYGSTAGTAVQGNTTFTLNGTANKIQVTGTTSQALGAGPSYTLSLPDNVTIEDSLTVSGDLTVIGTASFQNTTNLEVADRFILLASGSNATGDGGFVVQQATQDIGEVFGYDATTSRWGVDRTFDASTSNLIPEAFVSLVVEGGVGEGTGDVDARYVAKGNIFIADNEDIFIYS